jgi:hypothetical protein
MTFEKERRSGRKMVALDCLVEGLSQHSTMRISDLGLGGGFVDASVQVQRDDRIHVTFTLDGQELRCAARVAHVQPAIGFGFAFVDLTDETRSAIERYLGADA